MNVEQGTGKVTLDEAERLKILSRSSVEMMEMIKNLDAATASELVTAALNGATANLVVDSGEALTVMSEAKSLVSSLILAVISDQLRHDDMPPASPILKAALTVLAMNDTAEAIVCDELAALLNANVLVIGE